MSSSSRKFLLGSGASGIDEMTSVFAPGSPLAVFTVEIAVPAGGAPVAGCDVCGDGENSAEWRPFPLQEHALADYAKQIVERFGFKAEVGVIGVVGNPWARGPGIILIDPRFIADEKGRSALESVVRELPRWVLPLLVLDPAREVHDQVLADQARDIFDAAGALATSLSRRTIRGVSSLGKFLSVIPVLVSKAERQYLRYGGLRYGTAPAISPVRPGLRHPVRPGEPDPASERRGERPDAH